MARIQVVPLPTQKTGDAEHTPFLIVIDQIADDEAWRSEDLEQLRHDTGAATVIGHHGTLDSPGAVDLTDEQRDTLLSWLTQPTRIMVDIDQATIDHAMTNTYGTIRQDFITGIR